MIVVNTMTLLKGEETYMFRFDDESRPELLRTFGRFASQTDLSFTWFDAAVLSQKIQEDARRIAEQADGRCRGK